MVLISTGLGPLLLSRRGGLQDRCAKGSAAGAAGNSTLYGWILGPITKVRTERRTGKELL